MYQPTLRFAAQQFTPPREPRERALSCLQMASVILGASASLGEGWKVPCSAIHVEGIRGRRRMVKLGRNRAIHFVASCRVKLCPNYCYFLFLLTGGEEMSGIFSL